MKRHIDRSLQKWKEKADRKVLLVRGARQVGKTYSIRKLGESFNNLLEVNFEEEPDIKNFFEGSLNPDDICEKLKAFYNEQIKPGSTLLFFDEIQACPNAIRALRFFYEKIPELHVIAAGSLLEFILSEIPSFGVGRITSLFMYPMTFGEFLIANSNNYLFDLIINSAAEKPIDNTIHNKILGKLKVFLVIGGMPAVVKDYCKKKDIRECQILLNELITSLKDDFAKYKRHSPVLKLQEVFISIPHQTGSKFKYSSIQNTGTSYGYKEALELLINAGLAYKIYHTSARGIPLGSQVKPNKFKVILFDVGIHQRLLDLNISEHMIIDKIKLINRGSLSELFTGLELLANSSYYMHNQLYYWHREAKSSNAEIDYLIQKNDEIIPIEVKAGTKGQMQSMYSFLGERKCNLGIRASAENFGKYNNIETVPIYAIGNLVRSKI